ncbi:Thiamine_BP domain-containing protein [Rubrivivax sp. A210]|uniref:MTH1187 family thiamine-binding protein n=1 Tax=Rubrivivax sp. A210 TaxID=2772301 RepID=UPI001917E02F|nr:MTH1187 family thiamine-binding protein [Rubrivivax sp. A210]CAD5366298.1 Thiamine_BP domain-containing protein [Rubrivivax sp. A210]
MVLLEFSMAPFGQGESVSAYVARILDIIDKSGVPYQLTPMGTILEGEWPEVMGVVNRCFEALAVDCTRIGVHLKVDYRAGPAGRLKGKTARVEEHLGRKLST